MKHNILNKFINKLKESKGIVAIQIVVIGAIVVSGAALMGMSIEKTGNKQTETGLKVLSDNSSYDKTDVAISKQVAQLVFFNKGDISPSNVQSKLETAPRLKNIQVNEGSFKDVLVGVFPQDVTSRKLKYTVVVNPDVISISDYGLSSATGYPSFRINARSGQAGYAQVKACATDGSNVCSTLNVTVGVPASGINVSESQLILNVNKSVQLKVSPSPSDAHTQEITWSDSANKLKNISYDQSTDMLTIVGREAGETDLTLTLVDTAFGGTIYKKTIKILVREGIDGVQLTIDNPIANTPAEIQKYWALKRSFSIHATNTINVTIEKFQKYISDTDITNLETLRNAEGWKDYTNQSEITDTGKYVYFRACQPEEDVQVHNGETVCGKAFKFVLAVDTTTPMNSLINAYRYTGSNIVTNEVTLQSSYGITRNNGSGELITTRWDSNIGFDIVTRQDNHSGFNKIEYQIGDLKNVTVEDYDSISDSQATWGVYVNGTWKTDAWATYTNKAKLIDSGYRIRFRVCDKLNNCNYLGSRTYLVDTKVPESFVVNGVGTSASDTWTKSKVITISNGIDRHSGISGYEYCLANTLDVTAANCSTWTAFDNSGGQFEMQAKYIFFRAVDRVGLKASDNKRYTLNIENEKPKVIKATGAALNDEDWETGRSFVLETSKPLSSDLLYYYRISEKNNTGFGAWKQAVDKSFAIKESGRYVQFRVCLSKVSGICGDASPTYNLFVDSTKPVISNITGGSKTWAKSKTFTINLSEAHSGWKEVQYSPNGSTSWVVAKTTGTGGNGAYVLTASVEGSNITTGYFRVLDKVGNTSLISSVQNIYVDNIAPSETSIAGGASTTWAKSKTLTFKSVTDNITNNVITYKYCISGSTSGCSNVSAYSSNESSISLTINASSPVNTGVYIFTSACDAAGNCSTPVRNNLYVDNVNPTINSVSGEGTSWATSRSFTLTNSDTTAYKGTDKSTYTTQSGFNTYEYQLRPCAKDSDCSWSGSTKIASNSITINEETTQVRFRVFDKAGNSSNWSQAYNVYTQPEFTISVSGGTTNWSSDGSRTFTVTSTCKDSTTYYYKNYSGEWVKSGTTPAGGTHTLNYVVNNAEKIQTGSIYGTCMGGTVSSKEASANVYIDRQYYKLTISNLNGAGEYTVKNGEGKSYSAYENEQMSGHHISDCCGWVFKWYKYTDITESGNGYLRDSKAYVNNGDYSIHGNYVTLSGYNGWWYFWNKDDYKGESISQALGAHNYGEKDQRAVVWSWGQNRTTCNCGGGCNSYTGSSDQNICLLNLYKGNRLSLGWG